MASPVVPLTLAAPSPMPSAKPAVMTATASSAAIPPATTHLARASGVASTTSRRPPVSSEAHFETNVAAANPAAIRNSSRYSWSQLPAVVKSKPGKICLKIRPIEGSLATWSANGPASEASSAPQIARPMPQDSARGSWSPNARLTGPRTPRTSAGRDGRESPAVTPRSRRLNSSRPTTRNTTPSRPTARTPTQSKKPTSGMWVTVQWNGLIASSGPPISRPLAIQSSIISEHRDACRAGASQQRGEREGDPAEEHGDDADPDREPERIAERDLVAQRRVAEGVRAHDEHDRDHQHRQPQQDEVGGQLLERDPALSERRGRDDVEAAAGGLAGERAGQGEDRPERAAQAEHGAVLPGDVAAHRPELVAHQRRVAEQVDHRRRHGVDELVDLDPGLGRREHGADGRAHDEGQPAEHPGRDEERQPRVADGLAEDAAEAVDPLAERDRREGRGRGMTRRTGASGHRTLPPRPRGRTAPGRSPRATAPGRRSRGARTGRPPGRPA